MDPHLFDLLWEAYREVGGNPADRRCLRLPLAGNQFDAARAARTASRSSASTSMARRSTSSFLACRSRKFARSAFGCSAAASVSIRPPARLSSTWIPARIRHWPRMTHDQLVKVFPDGRTVHVPSDGQPLRGYALALADVERRGGRPSETSLEAAREAGVVTALRRTRNFFARLFGRGKDADEIERSTTATTPDTATKDTRAPVAVASVTPPKPKRRRRNIVPLPTARPASTSLLRRKRNHRRLARSQSNRPAIPL